uniref:G protein-coupled receptor 37 like 1 n=1 Tax=Acanthochromis polyacanthus TaxID=80966 RepID=A0A3Q1H3M8_9TELE
MFFTAAKSVGQPDGKPEPLWKKTRDAEQSLSVPEMLDLDVDRHRRLSRGADEDEQQSTFSHSFENDWVTAPQVTEFSNGTRVASGSEDVVRGNASDHEAPGLFNPFYPLVEGSYAAYAVLFLAGLVLAVGVVGNMAVMCVVWNNYYMRSAWNYLLASMAFWDFLVLVLCLPVVVLNQLSHRRILGDITCRMVPYMEVVSLETESNMLFHFHLHLMSFLKGKVLGFLQREPGSTSVCQTSCLCLQGRMWWCFGCYFCLPVLFTILCQMATRNVNSDSSSAQKKQRSHDDRSSNQKRQQHQAVERQLNCTLLALAVVYGVCALPEHVCNITLAYTHITVSEDTAAMLALLHHFLLFFKSSVTPVLLLCLCKALGQAFMDCCCCCCQECQPTTAQGSPGSAQVKLKAANETSIFFDKAKDTSAILSISS